MRIEIKGVITVEAAIIMPFFTGVLLSIVIAGMYMHDVCVAKQLTQEGCQKMMLAIFKEYDMASDVIDFDKRMDRNIILHSTGVVTGKFSLNDDYDYSKKMKKVLLEELDERLFICDADSVSAKAKDGKIQLDVTLSNRLNQTVMSWMWMSEKTKKITDSKYEADECELIRITDVVTEG